MLVLVENLEDLEPGLDPQDSVITATGRLRV
jgi:hypothetical protein